MLQRLVETEKTEICKSVSKTFNKNRKDLLKQNKTPNFKNPIILIHNYTLPNVKKAVKKDWDVLKINNKFKDIFAEPPLMSFHINNKLERFFFEENNCHKKAYKAKTATKKEYSKLCYSKTKKICSKQVNQQTHFQVLSQKINNVLNTLNFKSYLLIYLRQLIFCKAEVYW